jgi:hypothetical protein
VEREKEEGGGGLAAIEMGDDGGPETKAVVPNGAPMTASMATAALQQ